MIKTIYQPPPPRAAPWLLRPHAALAGRTPLGFAAITLVCGAVLVYLIYLSWLVDAVMHPGRYTP